MESIDPEMVKQVVHEYAAWASWVFYDTGFLYVDQWRDHYKYPRIEISHPSFHLNSAGQSFFKGSFADQRTPEVLLMHCKMNALTRYVDLGYCDDLMGNLKLQNLDHDTIGFLRGHAAHEADRIKGSKTPDSRKVAQLEKFIYELRDKTFDALRPQATND